MIPVNIIVLIPRNSGSFAVCDNHLDGDWCVDIFGYLEAATP